jgi:hypothetical protein
MLKGGASCQSSFWRLCRGFHEQQEASRPCQWSGGNPVITASHACRWPNSDLPKKAPDLGLEGK